MSTKHYQPENGFTSAEVQTEDGQFVYWRVSHPLPLYIGWGLWHGRRYACACGATYKSEAEYELHWRKAYDEEKQQATAAAGVVK